MSRRTCGARQSMALRCVLFFIVAVTCQSATGAEEGVSCRVLDPELQGTYSGPCVYGLAEGRGEAVGKARYEGAFKQGRKHGRGVKVWSSGDRYEGDFVEDRKEGQGAYHWGAETPWAGQKYVGHYRNDKREGTGTYEWPDGERYTGFWKEDAAVGAPTMRMLAQVRDQRERLAAVSKPGLTVCRQIAVGSVVHDWLRGSIKAVDGPEINVRITDAGQFEHRVRGTVAGKGAEVRDWALMWTPCR